MADKISFLLFGEQSLDTQGFLADFCRNGNPSVLSHAFLDRVASVLQNETERLPSLERRHIPPFTTIQELSQRYYTSDVTHSAIDSALLVTTQLAHYIDRAEKVPEDATRPQETYTVGLCTGLFAAVAVSIAPSLSALVNIGAEFVLLAFRTGRHVSALAEHIHKSGDAANSWTYVVPGLNESAARSLLADFNELKGYTATSQAYISAITSTSIAFSGPPPTLKTLVDEHEFRDGPLPLPIYGPYHASHLYSAPEIEKALRIDDYNLSEVLRNASPRFPVISCSTGQWLAEKDPKKLITTAIRDIFLEPLNFQRVLESCVTQAQNYRGTSCLVIPLGPTHAANSLVQQLKNQRDLEVHLRRAPHSKKDRIAPHTGDHGSSKRCKLAIVGMAGRFPDAATHEKLWELLEKGLALHREVPADRFDMKTHCDPSGKVMNTSHTPYGAWIENPGLFDPRFFNMSPREAHQTDPMQRMAITTAYEALEMSGYVPNRTRSTKLDRVGSFYGQTSDDWREINAAQEVDTYFITGGVRAFGPGRINYHFGFSGPSFSVDTACSSSMAALQLACTSLWAKDCDTALVGGLSCMTNSDIFAGLSRGQFLSKNGPCATFDNDADGYCRADACATVIVKRLEDAIADKDNVLGVILGTATNHSADAVSITHPHAGTQEILYRNILNMAGVDPLDVDYVEMHGTGTQAGDATEMKSVTNVFAPRDQKRNAEQSLYLGSVKANVGHGEAASGVTALMKVLMMLQKNTVPPHVGIKKTINRTFPKDLAERNVHIAYHSTPLLKKAGQPRRVFVNNFSAAGGNSGLLLEDGPDKKTHFTDSRSAHIVSITAKSKSSVIKNAERLMYYIEQHPEASLADISYTTTARRIQHNWRITVSGSNITQVSEFIKHKLTENITPIPLNSQGVVFAFTGQGSHYAALGKELFENSSLFKETMLEFNNIAAMYCLPSFLPLIDGSTASVEDLSPVAVQLGLLCFEMAMARLWASWGINPTAVIGHSLGEYAALNIAGIISASDAIYLIGKRAQLLTEKCTVGSHGLLAVKASVLSIRESVDNSSINIACINGPEETVLSGDTALIHVISERLTAAGFKCMQLKVPFAFHSAQVDPILDEFEKLAASVQFYAPTLPIVSTLLGRQLREGETMNASYLRRHAREPVNFLDGIISIQSAGLVNEKTLFLEVGPHPVCIGIVKSTLGKETMAVSSLRRNESAYKTLSDSLSTLHTAGFNIDWNEYHRDHLGCVQLLDLPTYAFDEKNYWIQYTGDWCLMKGKASNSQVSPRQDSKPKISTTTVHKVVEDFVDGDVATVSTESDLARADLRSAVMGHLVNGAGLCPSSIYADMAMTVCEYAYKLVRPDVENIGINVTSMEVIKPLIARPDGASQILKLTANVDASRSSAKLIFSSGSDKTRVDHAHCVITFGDCDTWLSEWERVAYLIQHRIDWLKNAEKNGKASKIGRGLAYKLFSALVDYDAKYRGMEEVILCSENMEATSHVSFQTKPTDGTFVCSPYWIDSVAHISGFIVNGSDAVDSGNQVYVSHGWDSLRIAETLSAEKTYRSYVKMQPAGGKMLAGDVYVFDGTRIVAVVGGLKFQCILRAVLNTLLPPAGVTATPAQAPAAGQSPTVAIPTTSALRKTTPSTKIKTVQDSTTSLEPDGKKFATVCSQTMDIVAKEVGVGMDELVDNITFADLGIDSLMSLTIGGTVREKLEIELPSSIFLECPTIGQFKSSLARFERADSEIFKETEDPILYTNTDDCTPSTDDSTPNSDSSTPNITEMSPLSTPADDSDLELSKDDHLCEIIQNMIAVEVGVTTKEVADAQDLALLGVDSLMALLILGKLREKTDLSLPADIFVTCASIKDINRKLGLGQAPKPVRIPARSFPKLLPRPLSAETVSPEDTGQQVTNIARERFATSVLLQGKIRTATSHLWMVPDGSGSATSYTDIPEISPELAMWGLNSPYMKTSEEFTCGVPGIAAKYIQEVKRRQPAGPYILAGWSAGGVIAFEMLNQLVKAGDVVSHLIMIDAPCPLIIEALPASLHRWFASIGLLGDGDPDKLPPWLLPHFAASVAALSTYNAVSIPKDKVPSVTAIWCEDGVCKNENDPRPDPYPDGHARFLLDNRSDFGPNLWDSFLTAEKIRCVRMPGNHFSMMGGDLVKKLGDIIREAIAMWHRMCTNCRKRRNIRSRSGFYIENVEEGSEGDRDPLTKTVLSDDIINDLNAKKSCVPTGQFLGKLYRVSSVLLLLPQRHMVEQKLNSTVTGPSRLLWNHKSGNSSINVSAADRDTNVDEASHSRFAFDSQAMAIATERKNILLGAANGKRANLSSANTTASQRNDTLFDACDLGLPPSSAELFDSSLPWTPIPQIELDNPVVQNDQGTMMSRPKHLGAVPQLDFFSPWSDSQPSNLPFQPRTNAELPSPNSSLDATSPHEYRTNSKVSSPSCNCFTTCLQSLQALHNHSTTIQLASAFDMALTINRKAVEGCASMLACRDCVSKSGSNTTTMLLATIMEKILSFYQVALKSDLSGATGADAQMHIGSYRVANEDGRWLRSEILWRELRKLEELFGRFREVCGRNEKDSDSGVCSTLLGHLSKSLKIAYEELRMGKTAYDGWDSRFNVLAGGTMTSMCDNIGL
ncbi:hypothetical protein O988_06199 [Pseudogymnoascus sp. VKM F-3808]|nr:hypothetical protein O988_06199 [Pseudogymnoascus sp. VKM F-3808]